MSHFSTIKTKIKEKPILLEALNLLKKTPNVPFAGVKKVDLVITNPDHSEDHPVSEVDIAIGVDVGFNLNEETGVYDFIVDRQTWDDDIPVERFVEKLTQQYARCLIHNVVKEEGFTVDDEWEMDDNSIELTVSRWV